MWPFRRRRPPEDSASYSISDPRLLELFAGSPPNWSGESVTERSSLGLSAVWRSCALISGSIASLTLRAVVHRNRQRDPVRSLLDDPNPGIQTPFEWCETLLLHLLLHSNAYLVHVYNGAGALVGLNPVHPLGVGEQWDDKRPGGRLYTVTLLDGSVEKFDASTLTHIMGPSMDGLRGMSVISIARNSLGTAIAGDRSAAAMFRNGAQITGLVTPAEDDLDPDEAGQIEVSLNASLGGTENAGTIRVINRKLNMSPWTMSHEDAQWLQSRAFSIEEIGRWFGIPPHLLGQSEKSTSWGTGISEQDRGLAKYVLRPWTTRIEQRLSRLLGKTLFAEFDFTDFLRPAPADEVRLLIEQVAAGLLTLNEARAVRNLPPIDGGDVPRGLPSAAPAAGEPVDEPEDEAA